MAMTCSVNCSPGVCVLSASYSDSGFPTLYTVESQSARPSIYIWHLNYLELHVECTCIEGVANVV